MITLNKTDKYQNAWQKFIEGDDKALSLIYFEFFDILLNFGLKYSSDRYLIEDCIQNVFVSLLKKRGKLNHIEDLKFYLIKALRNQMMTELRKIKNIVPVENTEETDFRIVYSIEDSIVAKEKTELQAKFLEMVKTSLTDRQKEAIYLKFICGFDYVQIAELMQISIESTRTIVYRTLKTINQTFGTKENANSFLYFLILIL